MGVALQVRSARAAVLVARVMQHQLMTACVPPVQETYVDHIDPVPDDAIWQNGDGVATVRLPFDVYTVQREELLARPGEVPAGAITPKARAAVVLEVSVSAGAVVFAVKDVPGVPEELHNAILDLIGALPPVDLTAILTALGVDVTSGGRVAIVGDLLVAQFGDSAEPAVPVPHQFEWALSLDGRSMEKLIQDRIPRSLPPLQSVTTWASWQPWDTGMLKALISGPVEVQKPAVLRVEVELLCAFSVAPRVPELRIDVGYTFDADTGLLAYEPTVALLVERAEDLARAAVDPAVFGGVRTGEATFAITLPLPQVNVAGEQWPYEGMVFDLGGLVIGGRMNLPVDITHVRLDGQAKPFSGGNFLGLSCRRGDPETEVATANLVSTVAEVSYDGGGRLCDVELLPAGKGLEAGLTLPGVIPLSSGVRPGNGRIFLSLGVESANAITEPVLMVLRTPRGVRCHSLGRPEQFTVLPDGTVEGVTVMYFDDCNRLPVNFENMTVEEYERWSGVIWYSYWGLVPGKDYDPDNPPIIPASLEDVATSLQDLMEATAPGELDAVIDVGLTLTPPDEVASTDTETMAVPAPGGDGSRYGATEEGSTVAELKELAEADPDG